MSSLEGANWSRTNFACLLDNASPGFADRGEPGSIAPVFHIFHLFRRRAYLKFIPVRDLFYIDRIPLALGQP